MYVYGICKLISCLFITCVMWVKYHEILTYAILGLSDARISSHMVHVLIS